MIVYVKSRGVMTPRLEFTLFSSGKYDKTKILHVMCTYFRTKRLVYVYELSELCLSEHKHGADDANSKVYTKETAVIKQGI